MLWEFEFLFSTLNVNPDLVNELRSWILKMPDAKYMDVVTSEAWNNRVEALRVLGEIIGKITPVGTPNSPVPDVWRPCYFLQKPPLSSTLKAVGLTYHEGHWDEYINYKQYVDAPDMKTTIKWSSFKNTNFMGAAEYWFEALRSYDKVRVEGQVSILSEPLYQAGMHIYFVKSGDSIAGKPESQLLCISDRTDVQVVGHIFKPYNANERLLFFDHELGIYDYVKYLVVMIDDPSSEVKVYGVVNELKITAL
jgi:hypothetical protein